MIRKWLIVIFWFFGFNTASAQVSHEIGLGFSALRIWEQNPPGFIIQDLDYYYNPFVGYQAYFFNDQFTIGTQLGWVNERGSLEKETNDGETEFREDTRKSVMIDVEVGTNLLNFENSFVQLTAGVRASKVYYFEYDYERVGESSVSSAYYESENWKDTQYGLTTSLSYQIHLINGATKRNQLLALRFSWELVYFFPELRALGTIENEFSSIATGPSVSLVWRIGGGGNGRF